MTTTVTHATIVSKQHVEEMKHLVESGDLVLDDERTKFKKIAGRETTLIDQDLLICIAATDDDDDDLFVANVKAFEDGNLTVVD